MVTFVTSQIMGTALEITDRYSDVKVRGFGAAGVIYLAHDLIANQTIAIKKIGKPFDTTAMAKRTYREAHLLSKLRHGNLVNMRDIFISPSEDLYIVTDCMMTNLHHLMRSTSKPLEGQFVQFFTYQMLRGLKYIHSAGVIHHNLKPSNLLINHNCDLKICDFGLAREQDHQMTGYVTTRYYRAPEIMLSWQQYANAVDIWSVGCILAEMTLGKALFPGKDQVHQFTLITELLGKPPKDVMERVYSKNVWWIAQPN
ncbi:Mitogen-activated protein kinase [Penicillium chrysogenum]|uniref:Mitogen-activated protein kinase n=1 Tax=Penicillium chrysogenum TaxID=5076 RepID=A0A167T406_PENCH|nr:Mitogen-activated protein kinase [Penicillium chrysogenum]